MVLNENGDLEECLLFVRKFNMTIEDLGIMEPTAQAQCLCKLVRGAALLQFDLLSTDVESETF